MLRDVAADPPPYLPVLTVITRPDGSSMTPVAELRIMSGLTIALVTGDGPDRYELTLTPTLAPGTEAIPRMVTQAPLGSGFSNVSCVVVAGAINAPCAVAQLDLFAGGALTADVVNYVTVALTEQDGNGGSPIALDTFSTTAVDWVRGVIAYTWTPTPGYQLAAGHSIVATWNYSGTGASVPGCTWRIT